MAEGIWYKDPRNFAAFCNLPNVIPLADMSFTEQLNAVFRLACVYAAVMFTIRQTVDVVSVPILVGFATYVIHTASESAAGAERYSEDARGTQGARARIAPTRDNPFMNTPSVELNTKRAPISDPLLPSVREEIDRKFHESTYADSDDLWSRNNAEQRFYTTAVPSGIPDQAAFANWLFGAVRCSGKEVRPPL